MAGPFRPSQSDWTSTAPSRRGRGGSGAARGEHGYLQRTTSSGVTSLRSNGGQQSVSPENSETAKAKALLDEQRSAPNPLLALLQQQTTKPALEDSIHPPPTPSKVVDELEHSRGEKRSADEELVSQEQKRARKEDGESLPVENGFPRDSDSNDDMADEKTGSDSETQTPGGDVGSKEESTDASNKGKAVLNEVDAAALCDAGEAPFRVGPNGKWEDPNSKAMLIEKKKMARENLADFNMNRRPRLEELIKTGNRFAVPLMKGVERFEQANRERPEVIEDADLSDPTAITLGFQGDRELSPISVLNWFSIEARDPFDKDYDHAWFEDLTVTNMVRIDRSFFAADVFFFMPLEAMPWISQIFSIDEQAERLRTAIKSVEETGRIPLLNGSQFDFPAHDMPRGCNRLVLPVNSNSHWYTVILEPNRETGEGVITLYNSLEGPKTVERAKQIMPLLAQLISLRPELDWRQESWSFVTGKSTRQANAHDCGPITSDNCSRLMQRLEPTVVTSAKRAEQHGAELRYRYLQRLYPLFTGEPFKGVDESPSKEPKERSSTSSAQVSAKKAKKKPKGAKTKKQPKGAKTSGDGMKPLGSPELGLFVGDDEPNSDDDRGFPPLLGDEDDAALAGDTADDVQVPGTMMGWREVLCNLLCGGESLTLDELTARALQQDEGAGMDADSLSETLGDILERTTIMFDWDWRGDKKAFSVLPGAGISVDSATNQSLRNWMPSCTVADCGDMLRAPFDIGISYIRSSGFLNMTTANKMPARGLELFTAYWNKFGDGDEMPPCVEANDETPDGPFWARYFREKRSSLLNPLKGEKKDDLRVQELLAEAEAEAEASGKPKRVLLVGNGFDGICTAGSQWTQVRDRWRHLDLYIALALPENNGVSGMFEDDGALKWAHYKVSTLAKVFRSPPHQAIHNAIDPKLVSDAEAQATIERCVKLHHEQFLWLGHAISCWKLDMSASRQHNPQAMRIQQRRPILVADLLRGRRNHFVLRPLEDESRFEEEKPKPEKSEPKETQSLWTLSNAWSDEENSALDEFARKWKSEGGWGDAPAPYMVKNYHERFGKVRTSRAISCKVYRMVDPDTGHPRLQADGDSKLADMFVVCAHEDWILRGNSGAIPLEELRSMLVGRFKERAFGSSCNSYTQRRILSVEELRLCRETYHNAATSENVGCDAHNEIPAPASGETSQDRTEKLSDEEEAFQSEDADTDGNDAADQDEDTWYFDCSICGMHGENLDDGSHSVACERCNVWQHSKCHNFSMEEVEKDEFHFVCAPCNHKEDDGSATTDKQLASTP